MTRVAFAAGRWIVVTVASVLVLERLTDLAAQSVAGNGPLGSRTLGSDRPHGLDALADVLGIHAGSSARLRRNPDAFADLNVTRIPLCDARVRRPVPPQAPSAQPARVLSGCEPVTDTRRIG